MDVARTTEVCCSGIQRISAMPAGKLHALIAMPAAILDKPPRTACRCDGGCRYVIKRPAGVKKLSNNRPAERRFQMPQWLMFVIIGLFGGVTSGMFGIGGGIVIVPALVYWAGFSQHRATGTSLAVLLPPIGIAATFEYYRNGHVDFRAAMIIAASMLIGAWEGSLIAHQMRGPLLRLTFGVFVSGIGVYLVYGAFKRLGWL
jgi:uncharacterized membrane protein AbrB (regulator of aidB expression)